MNNSINNGNGINQSVQQSIIQSQPMTEAPKKTSGVCIAALIFAFLISPVGLILGIVGLATYKKNNQKGKGLAIAAILISIFLPV